MTDNHSGHVLEILQSLTKHQVKFVVCGGVAAVLYGVERLTMNIDLALQIDEENLKRFLAAMYGAFDCNERTCFADAR